MWTIIILLLILWAGLSIFGFVVKGLLWLALIGIVLFVITALMGVIRGRKNRA